MAMIHELRVMDKDGEPVQLTPGSAVAITVDGSESYSGRVVRSDPGGATRVDFDDSVYAEYRAARTSKRAPRFRNTEAGAALGGETG
jgi:hypothetical protein